MSVLSPREQELLDLAAASLPEWYSDEQNGLETLAGFAKMFGKAWDQIDAWVDIVYLKRAFGIWLDAHARDHGTRRQAGESDATLLARLETPQDMLTKPALIAISDAILAGSGLPTGTIILETRQEQAYWQTTLAVESFWGMGQLWHNHPHAIIVVLPSTTDATTITAVAEAMRLFAAGGVDVTTEAQPSTRAQLVTVTPPAAQLVHGGAASPFVAQVRITDTVTWAVNGVVGGNSTVGTVDGSGNYTPPAAVPSPEDVEVQATSVLDSTVVGRARVKIL